MNLNKLKEAYSEKRKELLNFNTPNENAFKNSLEDYLFYLDKICHIENSIIYSLNEIKSELDYIDSLSFENIKAKKGKEGSISFLYWAFKYYVDDRLVFSTLFDTSLEDGMTAIASGIKFISILFDDDASTDDALNVIGKMDNSFTSNNIRKIKSMVINDFVESATWKVDRCLKMRMLEDD